MTRCLSKKSEKGSGTTMVVENENGSLKSASSDPVRTDMRADVTITFHFFKCKINVTISSFNVKTASIPRVLTRRSSATQIVVYDKKNSNINDKIQ